MKTQRLNLAEDYRQSINRAAEILKEGGTVAIPTETVYGLAASAYDEKAIEKIFRAKGRPQDNPLIVHIAALSTLNDIAYPVPRAALDCADKFWPGPFTMVLKSRGVVADAVSAGLDTVAVRMPGETAALDIIKACGLPLAAPSANISGSPSPTNPAHVLHDLDGRIDAVVMGQECGVGVESTVVSFAENPPRLLRPGGITAEQLREIIPGLTVDPAVLAEPESDAKVSSPGMKYKHYAPKTDTFLIEGASADFAAFVNAKEDCAAVCFDEESDAVRIQKISYGSRDDGQALARGLFGVLRQIDTLNVKAVYIHAPPQNGVGLAVYNRLLRAAGFRVIRV